jgi:hypothetical protein
MNPFVDPAYPPATGAFTPREASAITDFIVHHSDGPQSQTPLEIDAFERNGGDIYMPYTWLIGPDGTIYTGRPALVESAASYGRNEQSVAVCIIGAFQEGTPEYNGPPTDAALDQLLELCVFAHRQFPSIERTIAHRDIAPLFYPNDEGDYATACCGSVLYAMLPDIRAKVAAELHPI